MSFLKEIVESFSSIFSNSVDSQQSSSTTGGGSMDSDGGVSTGNERTAYKLKGYFDLAKEEIAKAVRAEEWGLPDDAVSCYQNAQRILSEAISTPVPSYISSRYKKIVVLFFIFHLPIKVFFTSTCQLWVDVFNIWLCVYLTWWYVALV